MMESLQLDKLMFKICSQATKRESINSDRAGMVACVCGITSWELHTRGIQLSYKLMLTNELPDNCACV
jgi:hypothetical protein